jgi:histidine triad (HIT) family protein
LIVPREHRDDIWSLEADEATAVMSAAHGLATVLRDSLGAVGVNLRQNSGSRAGQDVFHFHLHLVPRYEDDTVQPGCVW